MLKVEVLCGAPVRGTARQRQLRRREAGWGARTPPANEAMALKWFEGQRLVSLAAHHATLQAAGNRRVRSSTLGGVRRGSRDATPYSISATDWGAPQLAAEQHYSAWVCPISRSRMYSS